MADLELEYWQKPKTAPSASLADEIAANRAGILSERQRQAFLNISLSRDKVAKALMAVGGGLFLLVGLPVLSMYANPSVNRIDGSFILIALLVLLLPVSGAFGWKTSRKWFQVWQTGGQVKMVEGKVKIVYSEDTTSLKVGRLRLKTTLWQDVESLNDGENYRVYYEAITKELLSAVWKRANYE